MPDDTNEHDARLPAGVTSRLILVRHGEPTQSARGRCYGKLDISLSERGRTQAEQLAAWSRRFHITRVISSPRRRATDTAASVARAHNLTVEIDERLREIDFGAFEGLTYDEVARRYPAEYQLWMTRPTEIEFPAGESFERMRLRVLAAAADARTAGGCACLVAHGGTSRIILADALQMPAAAVFRLDQTYAAASIIDFYDETPVVRSVNFAPHLSQPDALQL